MINIRILSLGVLPFFHYPQIVHAQNEFYPKQGTTVLGSIQKVKRAGKPAEFLHEYLFRFTDGKWSGARYGYMNDKKVSDTASVDLPYDLNMQIFFDGRQLGSVLVQSKSCKVPEAKMPVAALKIFSKYNTLITTSIQKPTDLEAWKPLQIKQAPFPEQEIRDAWMNSDLCLPPQGGKTASKQKKPALQIEKIYAPKNRTRHLVIAKKIKNCDFGYEDYSQKVWLFRDSSGKWTVAEGNDLIEIGDFNGDGTNEALFRGAHNPPANTYILRNMETFQALANVESSADVGEGPCYNIIGG